MCRRIILVVTLAGLLAGCRALDGDYYPACIAFEGDHVQLAGSSFAWDRFTDQVKLGPDRQPIDPFPDYPRRGAITVSGDTLQFAFEDDDSVRSLHVVVHQDRTWLLTDSQKAAFDATGTVEPCALVREGD